MHEAHAPCSSSCTYRSLYEGTQASLTDMAARQSQALGRVGRLRSAVISAMKAARPGRFAEIEQHSKLRVQDGDDTFVVAVLEHILREHPADASRENYVELREALRPWGVELTGEDMAAWVHQLRGQTPRSLQSRDGVERAAVTSFSQAARARQEQSSNSWESAAKLGVSEIVKRIAVQEDEKEPNSWMELSTSTSGAPAQSARGTSADSRAREEVLHLDVDELFAPSEAGPEAGSEAPPAGTLEGAAESAAVEGAGSAVAQAEEVLATTDGVDDVPATLDDEEAAENTEEDIFAVFEDDVVEGPADDFGAVSSDEDDPFSDAFDADEPEPLNEPSQELLDETSQRGEEAEPRPGAETPTPEKFDTASVAVPHTAGPAVEPDTTGWVAAFPAATPTQQGKENPAQHAVVANDKNRVVETPAEVAGSAAKPSEGGTPVSEPLAPLEKPRRKVAPAAPVRVELFPHTTPQRPNGTRKRKPKKSALPPEAFSAEGVVQSGLLDKTRAQLLATCLTPRPVFSGDLADLVGDVSVVEEWQEETYSNGSMRFIDAKTRHRQLGSLAIPHGETRKLAADLEKSWWGAAMDRYRGAKLYELGVVGRKLGTSIRSWHVDPVHPVVSLRVNDERGLQGVIIVCDDELEEGGMGRRGVVSEIETMMREPLEIMYVLATGDKTLDPLVSAVEEEARRRGWKAPCSVVCARSWEWTDGSGPLIAVL